MMTENHNKPPSKADQKRYRILLDEVRQDIECIDNALRRITKNLRTIHDRRLYLCGGYSSFGEFSLEELGKGRAQAYRLLNAHEVLQNLVENGVNATDLPPTERLCREIRQIKDEDEQARVWKTVNRIAKDRGRTVTVTDIKEEALAKASPSAIDRQKMELVQKFEGMERALHVSFRFDVLDPPFRKRLLVALQKMADAIALLIASLESEAVQNRISDSPTA